MDGDRFAEWDARSLDSVKRHVAADRECRCGIVAVVRHTQQTMLGALRYEPVAGVRSAAQYSVTWPEAGDLGPNRRDAVEARRTDV